MTPEHHAPHLHPLLEWEALQQPQGLTLALEHQKDPRDEPCLKGEHLTDDPPVVCRPNKPCAKGEDYDRFLATCVPRPREDETAWQPESTGFGDVVSVLLWAALLFFLGRKLLRRWRARTPRIRLDPAGAIPAGRLMASPTLGWGDLGWGSRRSGFMLPRDALGLHVVMAGGTGSGKTNSAEVLEYGAAITYRPQVIHFDCKGSRDGMARFVALMALAGIPPERVRLFPIEPYDGWRGGDDPPRALLARLVQVEDWSEPFYAAGTKDLLQRAVTSTFATSSAAFIEGLERLPANGNRKLVEGAQARYRGFFNSLGGALDGHWAFEDCDACYIQLEGFGLPSEATALGRYLLEDLTHYLAERKPPEREVLLVLDEFSAISSGADAANLIERAREFGAGVILTTQSYAGLGKGAERVLDAARGALIVHSLANPEPFTVRAGTVQREMVSISQPVRQGVLSSILTGRPPEMPRQYTRLDEFPRIDPNEVRQLPRGEAFVISGGRAQRVAFNRLELSDESLDVARDEIDHCRAFIPRRAPISPATNGLDF